MTIIYRICLVAVLLAPLCSCQHGEVYPEEWRRADAVSDSLTNIIEWKYIDAYDIENIIPDIDKLEALAKAARESTRKDELHARVRYWRNHMIDYTDAEDELAMRTETVRQITVMHSKTRAREKCFKVASLAVAITAAIAILLTFILTRAYYRRRLRRLKPLKLQKIKPVEQTVVDLEMPAPRRTPLQAKILEYYPNLSDAELRLACLIASGKNKYDIAAEMEIRVESVKQARWRLRQKLSLSSDQDLDQLLIAIAQ